MCVSTCAHARSARRFTFIPPIHTPGRAAAKHAFGLKSTQAASRLSRAKGTSLMAATVGVVESPLEEKTRLSNKVWFICVCVLKR